MPSYKNFQNQRTKDNKSESIFIKSKSMKKEVEITEERRQKIIEWTTFYRRNIHLFIEHYFGIHLHPYQILLVYMMNKSDSSVAICSRAVGKIETCPL